MLLLNFSFWINFALQTIYKSYFIKIEKHKYTTLNIEKKSMKFILKYKIINIISYILLSYSIFLTPILRLPSDKIREE